jgi:hypothetical protein
MVTRRNLIFTVAGFCVYAFLAEVRASSPLPRSIAARKWTSSQDELARGLASGRISQLDWHRAVSSLASEVDLEDLSRELRRAKVRSDRPPSGHDPQKRFVTFLTEEGVAVRLSYGVALFDFASDSVITPHAHKHMVSAHMVLEGKVRIRTYDRVQDEEGALLIRPKSDEVAEPGHSAAMTSVKDNIHWFTPRTKTAMTLDVIIDGLDRGQERYLIQPIDPKGGRTLSDGTLRAPLVSIERSMEIYSSAD